MVDKKSEAFQRKNVSHFLSVSQAFFVKLFLSGQYAP